MTPPTLIFGAVQTGQGSPVGNDSPCRSDQFLHLDIIFKSLYIASVNFRFVLNIFVSSKFRFKTKILCYSSRLLLKLSQSQSLRYVCKAMNCSFKLNPLADLGVSF